MEKYKLRQALAVVLSILALAITFTLSAYHSYKARISTETERLEASLADTADAGRDALSSFLGQLCAEGRAFARIVSLTGADSQLLYRCFERTTQDTQADSALLFGSDGSLKYGAVENSDLFSSCAMEALRTGEAAYSDVLSCADGQARFAVSVPCSDDSGSFVAVTLLYPASLLEGSLNSVEHASLRLLNADGSPLLASDEAFLWQLPQTWDTPVLPALSGECTVCLGNDGGEGIVYATPAGISSIYIVSAAPVSSAHALAASSFQNSSVFILVAFCLLAAIAVSCIAFLSSRQRKLKQLRERYNFTVNQSNRVVFEYRRDRDRLSLISTCESISLPAGDPALTLGSCLSLIKNEDRDEAANAIRILHEEGCTSLTIRISGLRSVGDYRWYHITAEELSGTNSTTVIGTIEDIDEREKERIDLLHKALTDPLTGLYNRAETERMINEQLASLDEGQSGTFCIVDLDNFKLVNDNNGHDCGDRALKFFASRLRAAFRLGDIIGRLGGDEFIVYMERTADRDVVQRRFDGLMDSLSVRESAQELRLPELTCSIGCVAARAGDDFALVYNLADKALYRAKSTGKRKAEFEESA